MSDFLISSTMALGWASLSLKTLSITESSVAVVSEPQNAVQSFTVIPAAITSLPRLTVPATKGTWRSVESSSKSSMEVWGWTCTKCMVTNYSTHFWNQDIQEDNIGSCTYQTTSVGEYTVTAHKNITGNCLPENFYSQNICNHLLSFLNKNFTMNNNKARQNHRIRVVKLPTLTTCASKLFNANLSMLFLKNYLQFSLVVIIT